MPLLPPQAADHRTTFRPASIWPPQVEASKLAEVEAICRRTLAASLPVYSEEVALASAKEIHGLRAVFGEVYPDPVRVVSVGVSVAQLLAAPKDAGNMQYSIEFCGARCFLLWLV